MASSVVRFRVFQDIDNAYYEARKKAHYASHVSRKDFLYEVKALSMQVERTELAKWEEYDRMTRESRACIVEKWKVYRRGESQTIVVSATCCNDWEACRWHFC